MEPSPNKKLINGEMYDTKYVHKLRHLSDIQEPMFCCVICHECVDARGREGHCVLQEHVKQSNQLVSYRENLWPKIAMMIHHWQRYEPRIAGLREVRWRDELRGRLFNFNEMDLTKKPHDMPVIQEALEGYEGWYAQGVP